MFRLKRYLLLLVCLVLISCAGAQTAYNNLTPEQQTIVRIDFFQSQLNLLFDQGKAFVTANPQYQVTWKTKVIPAFDTANKILRGLIINAKNPNDVDAVMDPLIISIMNLLPVFAGGK